MKKQIRGNGFFLILLLVVAVSLYLSSALKDTDSSQYNTANLVSDIKAGNVKAVEISQEQQTPSGYVTVYFKSENSRTVRFNCTDVESVEKILYEMSGDSLYEGTFTYTINPIEQTPWWVTVLPYILGFGLIIFLFSILNSQNSGGGNSKVMNFGKSRARITKPDEKSKKFRDVAGLVEEKEQLEEVVDFLKNPKKYTELGARIPKGILMVGPPGTGKTLLAKAVAGEAGVPFFSISGSDFVEMFVGVGASRVRDLFTDAKKNAPCIVFIDEIDAVARRRGTGLGGGHDEREQTLNQMLVEMDGFGVNEGIIVMAATNRVDILDPAILRPGRFDRRVEVGRPDIKGREDILRVHAANKPLGDDVDLKSIAGITAGMTGADLENLLNEAAINAAKFNRAYIIQEDITGALIKVGIGPEKKSKIVSEKDKRITAYHEAGHAILFHVLPDVGPVHTVSIIPTGLGAAGYTMPLPEKDEMFNTKGKMLQDIIVSLGGRIAEDIIFDDITTGASQDIRQATSIAKNMVTKYGFSDAIGMITMKCLSEGILDIQEDSVRVQQRLLTQRLRGLLMNAMRKRGRFSMITW